VTDVFIRYETGLHRLLERLGSDHAHYVEALTLQSRLLENIAQTRQYGDMETRRAERAQILDTLNRLALQTVGVSFNKWCELATELRPTGWPNPSTPTSPWPLTMKRTMTLHAVHY
jgi:hypothetical protein